ncbi:DUF2272 domain-containing protein [Roseomonas xinghualingensis]|uniref:DUF2272 domain-containing protein n=1 Tax=Roseomonas xinghualingensis TaxID=2986475 RepID=UPI0021F1FE26|nr:DUF2272 domain-containing protein [Roseomonas sp. SXEYE001]MCV4206451.1 DUF2272 domain-containing protein [Roseomonas sp. SXEYE001]
MRWLPLLTVLLLLLLTACATPPSSSDSSEAPAAALEPAGPGATRLVAAAEREWREWGSIMVDGWPVALERTPDATPELFDRLMSYWASTPEGPEVITDHLHYRDTIMAPEISTASLDPVSGLPFQLVAANVAISAYNHPAWSAAFISHAMGAAGMPRYDFDPSASHALYIDRMLESAMMNPESAAFRPHSPADYAPRPGDLICADRSAYPLPNWQARTAEPGRFRPMHCDIVVRAGGGSLEMIGGNVLDVVLRRRIPTDAQGRAQQPPLDRPPYFAIFENRR